MDRGPADVHLAFVNEAEAPRDARRAISALFHRLDPIADAVVLVVSELVSNVVQHSGDGGVLRAWQHGGSPDGLFRVEVEDHSPILPVLRNVAGDTLTGRGLFIVDKCSTAWGITPTASGKTVWAEFKRPSANWWHAPRAGGA